MRENGFLEASWSEVTLQNILALKPYKGLISVSVQDRMVDVISLMKDHDISQVPVLKPDGTLEGIVTEIAMLDHMLNTNSQHSAEETVAAILQEPGAVFPSDAILEEILPSIAQGHVILVVEKDRPTGILTKIDILDYIAQEI